MRIYTAGSGWSGTAGLDSLTDPGAIWFSGAQRPFVSAAVAGGDPGVVEIEVITDQGFSDTTPGSGEIVFWVG